MQSIQLESEVGSDGVLHLSVPLGIAEAKTRVIVTLEAARGTDPISVDSEDDDLDDLYGSCADLGLEEPPDLPLQH
ncbi:MAG TPA: hypothetical protein VJ783_31835 [Pirellulales bacterium]|nr:hypothetical protein [Pirellulales bacterium]